MTLDHGIRMHTGALCRLSPLGLVHMLIIMLVFNNVP